MVDNLSNAVPPWLISLIPILIGGVVTHCKLFISTLDEFRSRIKLKDAEFFERLSIAHAELLERVRQISGTDEILRGDGSKKERDLVLEFSQCEFRYFRLASRLEVLRWCYRTGYGCLLLTFGAGILAAIFSITCPDYRKGIIIIDFVLVAIQLFTVISLFALDGKLDTYDDLS